MRLFTKAAMHIFNSIRCMFFLDLLQEVWVQEDYELLREKLTRSSDLYPYAHYFDNGIIGSGTCIFSKVT